MLLGALGALGLAAVPAGATGSITAVDTTTHQVGHAFASCTALLGTTDSIQQSIYFPAPGVGAVVGQAFYSLNRAPQMRARLIGGEPPAQIIDDMKRVNGLAPYTNADIDTASDLYDSVVADRQYEISSFNAPPATFTGSDHTTPGSVLPHYGETTSGTLGQDRFVGAAAGNTLTSSDFAGTMGSALQQPKDIVAALAEVGVTVAPADVAAMHKGDLAEHLFLSLEAAFGRPGQGDYRCVYATPGGPPPPPGTPLPPNTRSSSMSWLRVDNSDGSVAMNLRYRSLNNKDAVRELAQMYYACRMGRGSCLANNEDLTPSYQNFSYSFTSTAGNKLGKGQSLSYAWPDSTLSGVSTGRTLVLIVRNKADQWTMQLTPPRNANWVNGATYPTEGGARSGVAALNISRNGVMCSRPFGSLKINKVVFKGTGLASLSADFSSLICQGSSSTLAGHVRYQA
jgi:hypothetical protein